MGVYSIFAPIIDVFSEKLNVDYRNPFITFELPYSQCRCGVLSPLLLFWVQLTVLILIQAGCSAILALMVYKFAVKSSGSATSFLAVFGVVIPSAAIIPFQILTLLDIRSKTLTMSLIVLPFNVIFRSLEALIGFSPPAVEDSMGNYCLYYASLMECKFDDATKSPIRTSFHGLLNSVRRFILYYFLLSVLFSILEPINYVFYDMSTLEGGPVFMKVIYLFHPKHLMNNFVAAVMTSTSLSFSTQGISLGVKLAARLETLDVVRNPMFLSSSPSNFWGRRWNRLIHNVLKRSIYLPVRVRFSPSVAAVATFFVSGVIHEYVVLLHFFIRDTNRMDSYDISIGEYHPKCGSNLAFFAWNGIVILMEYNVSSWWPFQWIKRSAPRPVITFLVLLTALPVAHWFTDDWIKGGYFNHMQLGFPRIAILP